MHYSRWLLMNGLFLMSIYFGFVEEVEGAKNIALFIAWATSIIGLSSYSDIVIKEIFKKQSRLVNRTLYVSFCSCVLFVFLWYGHIVLSIFYLLHIIALGRLHDENLKIKLMSEANEKI